MPTAPNMELITTLRTGRRLMRATGPGKVIRDGEELPFETGHAILLGATGGVIAGPIDPDEMALYANRILNARDTAPGFAVDFAMYVLTMESALRQPDESAA